MGLPGRIFGLGSAACVCVRPWTAWVLLVGCDPANGEPDLSEEALIARARTTIGDPRHAGTDLLDAYTQERQPTGHQRVERAIKPVAGKLPMTQALGLSPKQDAAAGWASLDKLHSPTPVGRRRHAASKGVAGCRAVQLFRPMGSLPVLCCTKKQQSRLFTWLRFLSATTG